jgi:hypothetical protein
MHKQQNIIYESKIPLLYKALQIKGIIIPPDLPTPFTNPIPVVLILVG